MYVRNLSAVQAKRLLISADYMEIVPIYMSHTRSLRVAVGSYYIHNSMQLSRNSDTAQHFKLSRSELSLPFCDIYYTIEKHL